VRDSQCPITPIKPPVHTAYHKIGGEKKKADIGIRKGLRLMTVLAMDKAQQ